MMDTGGTAATGGAGNTGRTVAFVTLGCKANQYDTAAMTAAFRRHGYEVADPGAVADVYVINTCAVTGRSQAKSRQAAIKARRLNPSAVVVVSGCYPQVAPGEAGSLPEVDIVAGAAHRADLPRYVDEFLATGARMSCVDRAWSCRDFEEAGAVEFQGRTRAFVKIEDGCEQFCSYCIVPFARGPVRSRRPGPVLDEVRRLAAAGYKEIVLTGIHLGEYGKDLRQQNAGDGRSDGGSGGHAAATPGPLTLAGMVRLIHDVEGVERIRLSSVEPMDITPELVGEMGRPKVCPHLHVPLQSGSDRILEAMNRGYTALEFIRLSDELRSSIPGLGFTTDVMVGFPGETDADFDLTCDVVKTAGFSRLHVFPFSARPGTAAARMGGQVPRAVKERRARSLIKIGKDLSLRFHEAMVGSRVTVLVEEGGEDRYAALEGLTGNYVRVWFDGPGTLKGEIVTVEITGATASGVRGVLVDDAHGG
ncbi:MAG: MiaB/RimO family radical SAM methylthiotransferase [Firmicutes bacterium]|nr:MiaB/RimO family radical SAM methylthiotransferase [Bacillota bacterium]